MFRGLAKLIERQILKARAEGQLQGLEGEGKPLPNRPGDVHVSAADAAGFRIMAQAGVLPKEIELKKKILEKRQELQTVVDPEHRKRLMAVLAELEMKHGIAKEARQKFLKP